MKKICNYLLLLVSTSLFGQVNLVPNFSFEQYDTCPDHEGQIERSIGWKKFSTYISTPDFYNACAPLGNFNVPYSGNGYQQDHRNCSAFGALVTFAKPIANYRETIGMELSQPLIIGQKYFLSLYTVMAEEFLATIHFGMPTNNMGLRLSTVAYNINNPCPIDNFAHLYSVIIIDDSINWHRITGSIVADSAYKYIMVGNFFDDAHTDTMHYNCSTCMNYNSYYYIDDICVSTDSLLCNGGVDSMPCNVGIGENVNEDYVSTYPNPASDFIKVSFSKNQDAELHLIDLLGNTILIRDVFNKKDGSMNISSVSSGCYLLLILNKRNGTTVIKKIIII